MKKMIILGAMLAVTGLSVPVLAQTPKSPKLPDATATQMQAEAKPAPDDLITLLAAKGILTETEAALVSQRPPLPETKQVLAEVLLSKHIITKEEYDRTLQSCSNSPTTSGSTSSAQTTPSSDTAASSLPSPSAKGESSGFKSLSDRIAAILPGGGQTTDADFGVIQPSPRWSSPDQAALAEAQAKAKRKSHKKQEQDASQASSVPR